MKDQYFADVNDYRKYGLLRAILAVTGLRVGVCWMLTQPDHGNDGRHLHYLDNPAKFRSFDPDLFDWLQRAIHPVPDRRTARIEGTCMLPDVVYFSEPVVDNKAHRKAWFANCTQKFDGLDLIFFDPDNGLERSVAAGRRGSNKFLYWTEIRETFAARASVLVYQHFPREPRTKFIESVSERLRAGTGASAVFSFVTPHVLFLLAAQESHVAPFRAVIRALPLNWPQREIMAREMEPPSSGPAPVWP